MEEAESWLYGEGENANKSKYIEKKEELAKLCECVKNRFTEYENLPQAFKELDQVLFQYLNWANDTVFTIIFIFLGRWKIQSYWVRR